MLLRLPCCCLEGSTLDGAPVGAGDGWFCESFCDMVGTFLSSHPVPGQMNLPPGNTPHRVAVATAARDGKLRRRAVEIYGLAERDWGAAPGVIARSFRGARELRSPE